MRGSGKEPPTSHLSTIDHRTRVRGSDGEPPTSHVSAMISLRPIGNHDLSGHDHGRLLVRVTSVCIDIDIDPHQKRVGCERRLRLTDIVVVILYACQPWFMVFRSTASFMRAPTGTFLSSPNGDIPIAARVDSGLPHIIRQPIRWRAFGSADVRHERGRSRPR